MTNERAIALAKQFIEHHRLPIAEFIGARLMSAKEFNELSGYDRYNSDFWIVEYRKQLPAGVLAETPGNVLIRVAGESKIEQVFRETI